VHIYPSCTDTRYYIDPSRKDAYLYLYPKVGRDDPAGRTGLTFLVPYVLTRILPAFILFRGQTFRRLHTLLDCCLGMRLMSTGPGGAGAAGLISYLGFSDANEANDNLNDPLGLNYSAQDLFQQIIGESASPSN